MKRNIILFLIAFLATIGIGAGLCFLLFSVQPKQNRENTPTPKLESTVPVPVDTVTTSPQPAEEKTIPPASEKTDTPAATEEQTAVKEQSAEEPCSPTVEKETIPLKKVIVGLSQPRNPAVLNIKPYYWLTQH